MRAAFAALAASLAVTSVSALAQAVKDVDVLWVGTYKIAGTRPVEDPTAPTGYRYVSQGIEPLHATQRVPAAIGTRFGVAYVLRGEPAGAIVPVHAFWRFPPAGITNPETRTTVFEWKTGELQCRLEQQPFCLMGYPLQHPWELVPGRWTLEVWAAGTKVVETFFDVFTP
ncbi:MAG TPA: DUF3859 domain-containing protein [Burkholderiales bacterium]|nr:DUF3859 domain-containing protein [Burkholderiales bacterium]